MAGKWMRHLAMIAALTGYPALAVAQNQCAIPQSIPQGRAIFPPPGKTVLAPLTGHILALSWSPQFCKTNGEKKKNAFQCGGSKKFGFILHGLWPDGEGGTNPQWCKRVSAVPPAVMRSAFCATPSLGLMQYQWAKHGSCIERDAESYFRLATMQFNVLKFPDMNALSRSETDVATLTTALVIANPRLTRDMIRIVVTPLGWLEEVRLCLDTGLHPRVCPRDIGGAGPATKVKIWPAY